jgi:hypothetical protein
VTKSLVKSLLSKAVRNDLAWKVLNSTFVPFGCFAKDARTWALASILVEDTIKRYFPDLVVKHGVFRGMKYPLAKSFYSSLFPKLLGCYELEIQTMLERVCSQPYTEIVNIGCGEGYYAVGLAMRIPTARVFAFDTNREAVERCRRMADLNDVGQRVVTGFFCGPETLKAIPFTGRSFVLSDCEGYEKELFSEDVIPTIAKHDLLIELHDYIDIDISSTIRERFEGTHNIEAAQSTDDIKKAHSYRYDEITDYNLHDRKILLGECRPAIMEWYYLTPR